jgi:hypothetical protein
VKLTTHLHVLLMLRMPGATETTLSVYVCLCIETMDDVERKVSSGLRLGWELTFTFLLCVFFRSS